MKKTTPKGVQKKMLKDGFVTGVNYWASNAGIRMWTQFSPETIDDDFRCLAAIKLDVVRLFPLWPDFQPIRRMYGGCGSEREVRFTDERTLGNDPVSFAGLDETMLDRFSTVLDLAEKHGLHVCVGLLTGWMSGRLFVPPLLEGRNVLTDPVAIYYELRFVREFVRRFRDRAVIIGWTSGNETDCMAPATATERANWALNLYNAIRAVDPDRPIMEDMHPLRNLGSDELYGRHDMFDVTTVHPYVKFSPYADHEPMTSMRGLLHAVAEAKAYEGITGKPCLIEEIGSLGNFVCSKEISAGYAQVNAYSAWANGMTGLMWWCAHEQSELAYAPYDWCPLERELGLLETDKSEKPVAKAFRTVRDTIDALGGPPPKAVTDAVCVLSGDRNDWRAVLGSYVLSKQAGFNLAYCNMQHIPDAPVYILPSVSAAIPGRAFRQLAARVAAGATLLLTYDRNLVLSGLEQYFGLELQTNSVRAGALVTGGVSYPAETQLILKPVGAKVLQTEDNGNPMYTEYAYGKGKMLFCTVPVEKDFSEAAGSVDDRYAAIYRTLAERMTLTVRRDNSRVGLTVHPRTDGSAWVTAINYSAEPQKTGYTLDGRTFVRAVFGDADGSSISLPPYGMTVFEIR